MNKLRSMRMLQRTMLVATLALAIGCTPLIRNHGYIPPDEDLTRIVVGQDTRESVRALVGPPSADGVQRGGDYYYVQSTFRTLGFFAPEEIERQVLAIRFNESGVVTNIERYGLEEGQVVVLFRRVTDTGVQDTTFIRQLLQSIGRIDPGQFLGSDS
ncbi:Beta-barrel assembly machine subunit BamE [Cognatiyoonia sediminum]|uniref:Beta-barrel assembly machine subunit BamE n=1 Tax=Cognatiyoonia sediminum TaxID=1508389 RepID=A0A1M5MFJ6_9RHOB|nr:outer membrane protein assembly factor BamE [Cognatiyoonia sediminum]SHG76100.1 Beta-barrel assembly machine subunit BamE [Cognatiyoonia sediminum]